MKIKWKQLNQVPLEQPLDILQAKIVLAWKLPLVMQTKHLHISKLEISFFYEER